MTTFNAGRLIDLFYACEELGGWISASLDGPDAGHSYIVAANRFLETLHKARDSKEETSDVVANPGSLAPDDGGLLLPSQADGTKAASPGQGTTAQDDDALCPKCQCLYRGGGWRGLSCKCDLGGEMHYPTCETQDASNYKPTTKNEGSTITDAQNVDTCGCLRGTNPHWSRWHDTDGVKYCDDCGFYWNPTQAQQASIRKKGE